MKRRIALLLGTFLVLLLSFAIYKAFTGDIVFHKPAAHPDKPIVKTDSTSRANVDPRGGDDLYLEARDKQGNLETVYRAAKWQRLKDGSVALTQPRITIFQHDGQQLHVGADQGEIYTDELVENKKVVLRRGRLEKNVQIVMDQFTGPDRSDISLRPEDLVRVFAEDAYFGGDAGNPDSNGQLLQINTDHDVQVTSNEADFYGTGLSIRWNEKPRELRDLRIKHAKKMVIKNVREEMSMIGLTGAAASPSPSTAAPAAPTAPTARVAPPAPASPAAPAPLHQPPFLATMPAATHIPATEYVVGGIASQPVPAATTPATGPVVPQNVFLAELEAAPDGDIQVVQGDQKMLGAKTLSLRFDQTKKKKVAAASKPDAGAPPAGSTVSGSADKTPAAAPAAATDEPTVVTAAAPAVAAAPAASKPATKEMTITWDGPLVLRPVGYTDAPSKQRYNIKAAGPDLVLSDAQAKAVCKQFEYDSLPPTTPAGKPRQSGWIKGDEDHPAQLTTADGDQMFCPMMQFNGDGGQADMIGPGWMIRPSQGIGLNAGTAAAATATKPAAPGGKGFDVITWKKNAAFLFATEGAKGRRQQIKQATFYDKVELTESIGADKVKLMAQTHGQAELPRDTGNFIHCDTLNTAFAVGSTDKAYPYWTEAVGHVSARRDATDIASDRLDVTFKEQAETAADGKMRFTTRAATLDADGSVIVNDMGDPNQPVHATADHLKSDVAQQWVLLTGKPATAKQGPNEMTGPKIYFDQNSEQAQVTGAGTLDFLTPRDLDGRELPTPKLVKVIWADKMDYKGLSNTAQFNGSVILTSDNAAHSETETIHGQTMLVQLEKSAAAPAATTPAARDRHLSFSMGGFSKRRIEKFTADKNVLLTIRQVDETKHVRRRKVTCDNYVVYDCLRGTVDMYGQGSMLDEDYRLPPAKAKQNGATPLSGEGDDAQLPSQAVSTWARHMQWLRADRKVTMTGDVYMKHLTGNQIVLTRKERQDFLLPDSLPPTGHKRSLTCQELVAIFAPPAASKKSAPSTVAGATTAPAGESGIMDAGFSMGTLERFDATTDVNLEDGPMQILAQQVRYNPPTPGNAVVPAANSAKGKVEGQVPIEISGNLADQIPRRASLHYEDPVTGKVQNWEDQVINAIVAHDANGGRLRLIKVTTAKVARPGR